MRTREITVIKGEQQTQTQAYTVCVPETYAEEVEVQVCKRVAKTTQVPVQCCKPLATCCDNESACCVKWSSGLRALGSRIVSFCRVNWYCNWLRGIKEKNMSVLFIQHAFFCRLVNDRGYKNVVSRVAGSGFDSVQWDLGCEKGIIFIPLIKLLAKIQAEDRTLR